MRYLVLTFLCLIAVIGYVQRLGIQTAHEPIEHQFLINTEQFGMLGTAWLIGYALLQIPAGWFADRFGSRNALAAFAIIWSLITASIGFCTTYESLLALWFVMGLAQAGIFPCAAKSIGAWFPDTEKATASGLLGSFTMLGTATATFVTSRLLVDAEWSWGDIQLLYGSVGIVWALAYLALIPERGTGQTLGPALARPMTRQDWHRLVTSVPLWFLCGQQFFRAGAMIFFINWFHKFLTESRSFDEVDAGTYTAAVNLSALVGGILGGFLSDAILRWTGLRRLSRQGLAVIGMLCGASLVLATLWIEDRLIAVVFFSLAAFLATFGGVAGYTVAIEYGGARIGIVFSVMNMCGNFGAAIVNQVVGSLKERTGNWDTAVYAVVIILIIDAVCWALLNPTRPLFEEGSHASR